MKIEDIIREGNIITEEYVKNPETGRYLGNGRFGGVFSALGLNAETDRPETGKSQYVHRKHWGRFAFFSEERKKDTSADYILPLLKVYWEKEPKMVRGYRQCQDFYDGVLNTRFETEAQEMVRVTSWFDMENLDLAVIRIEVSGKEMPVIISPVSEFVPYDFLYTDLTHQKTEIIPEKEGFCLSIRCERTVNQLHSEIYLYSSAPMEPCREGIRLLAEEGAQELYISYGKPVAEEERRASYDRSVRKWHDIWEKSGWFRFPEQQARRVWVRSMAYLLSTYLDRDSMIQPVSGLTGNMFPFHFVQDMEYIAPALMMTGHADIVKGWVEKFRDELDDLKKYAKTLWPEADGIYPPWELPYGEIRGYHTPSVPVIYCYEPHNTGYLCRMAREAADFVGDKEWTQNVAVPLIRECCRFYRAFCKKEQDGMWHLMWHPCIGQDEAGGRNRKDYLCCLCSAEYCFHTAVEMGLDETGDYERILRDGLAFRCLQSDGPVLHTAYDTDDYGKQKHPVQLNGLAYFPVHSAPLPWERSAYEARYEITDRASVPFFYGWTLGEFLLAGSNIKDRDGWIRDWSQLRRADYTDSAWVQFYETSGEHYKPFYTATHGMILQSLIRNYVNDYWGRLDLAACDVFQDGICFSNIRTRFGIIVSGAVKEEKIEIELLAERDCSFETDGRIMTLKRGEKRKMILDRHEK